MGLEWLKGWPVVTVCLVMGCDTQAVVDSRSSCLSACLDADADVDVEAHLAFGAALRDRLLSARGASTGVARLAGALPSLFEDVLDGDVGLPEGFAYEGQGVYSMTSGDGTRVELQFLLPFDTTFGHAGEPIVFDVFDPTQYFTGLRVAQSVSVGLSGVSTHTTLSFTDVGEGAELLGLGDVSGSSAEVDLDELSSSLSRLEIAATIHAGTPGEDGGVVLSVDTLPTPVAQVARDVVPLSVGILQAPEGPQQQSVSLADQELAMVDGGDLWDGYVAATSSSPAFSFDMRVEFAASAAASVSFGCPGTL